MPTKSKEGRAGFILYVAEIISALMLSSIGGVYMGIVLRGEPGWFWSVPGWLVCSAAALVFIFRAASREKIGQ